MKDQNCLSCQRVFTPRYLSEIKKWTRVCARCGMLNLASFMEESEPDDTIAEISAGEQAGAKLREMVSEE